ncbi:MAG: nuclear transport factor 2 family protein [Acidimicrobiales bacterium]
MTTGTLTTVDAFLETVAAGQGAALERLYAADALLDAVVPDWRFQVRGAAAIGKQYATWFTHPATLEELRRLPTADGEVVAYTLAWEETVPHAARHVHLLTLDPATGRIVQDQVWCGGRWPAGLLAEMAAAQQAG